MDRPRRRRRQPIRFKDYEMEDQSEEPKETIGDKKSSYRSLISASSRADAVSRLANQDELVQVNLSTIKLLEGLLESTADGAERTKLVREIILEKAEVKKALRQKEDIMKDMPGSDEERSSLSSNEKLSNVTKYVHSLNLKNNGVDQQDAIDDEQNFGSQLPKEVHQVVPPLNQANLKAQQLCWIKSNTKVFY